MGQSPNVESYNTSKSFISSESNFINNPINLKFNKNIKEFAFCNNFDNTFTIFNSVKDNKVFLINSTKNKSLKLFDLNEERKINTVLNAHNVYITTIRYYENKKLNKDIILTG